MNITSDAGRPDGKRKYGPIRVYGGAYFVAAFPGLLSRLLLRNPLPEVSHNRNAYCESVLERQPENATMLQSAGEPWTS